MHDYRKNAWRKDPKDHCVWTPPEVAQFIYNKIKANLPPNAIILDPSVGAGALLKPYEEAGLQTLGIDIKEHGYNNTLTADFLTLTKDDWDSKVGFIPDVVVMNPPFNYDGQKEVVGGRKLLPECFMDKIIELFGKDISIVALMPSGFRLNVRGKSARRAKFKAGEFPDICSITGLPNNVFDTPDRKVFFHCEVLYYNFDGLNAHDFF